MTTKYCCHNGGKLILRAFFARSPDGSTVSFCYYLLEGDTAVPSRLLSRLCHAFLVFTILHYMLAVYALIIQSSLSG